MIIIVNKNRRTYFSQLYYLNILRNIFLIEIIFSIKYHLITVISNIRF